jgi:hypothetical protein
VTKVERSVQELESLLVEQVEFLKLSCTSYDSGFQGEIKRLAVSVRVLVHDTTASVSLLQLTGKKNRNFFDSSDPFDSESVVSHSSLVQFHLTPSGTRSRAHLDDVIQGSWIPFDAWWNGVVLVDSQRNEFSRKDIVLTLANKEGGAHVDHKIDEAYFNLRNKNAMGWETTLADGRVVPGEDNVPATMRQIAHELIKSMDQQYVYQAREDPEVGVKFRGFKMVMGAHGPTGRSPNLRKDRPMVGGKKVGRNDPCPCGSGQKYKRCCI